MVFDVLCQQQPLRRRTSCRSVFSFFTSPFSSFVYFSTLLLVIFYCAGSVQAAHNVTVDEDSVDIVYRGAWERIDAFDELSAGGFHVVSSDPSATATFSFRGTAVYLMFPMWPYQVAAWISLDGNPPLRIDLHDRTSPGTDGGRASRASSVLASAENLNPTVEHTLVISTRSDEQYVVLDRIIYTALDTEDLPTVVPTSSYPPPTVSPSSLPSTSSTLVPTLRDPTTSAPVPAETRGTSEQKDLAASAAEERQRIILISVGLVCAVLAVLAVPLGIFCYRRRKSRKPQQRWTIDPEYPSPSPLPPVSLARHYQQSPAYPESPFYPHHRHQSSGDAVLPSTQPQQPRPWMQHHAASASMSSNNSQTRLISPWSHADATHSRSHSRSHSHSHYHNNSSGSLQAAAYGGVEEYPYYPQQQPEQQQQQQYQTQAAGASLNQTRNLSYRSHTSGSHYSSATTPTAATMGSMPPTPNSATGTGTTETARGLPTPPPTSAHTQYDLYAQRTALPPAYSTNNGPSYPDSPTILPDLTSTMPVLQQVQAPSRVVVSHTTPTSPIPPPPALQAGHRPSQVRRNRSKSSTSVAGMSQPMGRARAMERLSTLRLHKRNTSTNSVSPDSDDYSSGDDKTLVGSLPRKSGFYAAGAIRSPPPPVPTLRLVQ